MLGFHPHPLDELPEPFVPVHDVRIEDPRLGWQQRAGNGVHRFPPDQPQVERVPDPIDVKVRREARRPS